MITILNYKKNKKITVEPCPVYLKNRLQKVSATAQTSDVWYADEAHFDSVVSALAELQAEGAVKQNKQGRYVASSKYLNRTSAGNF